MIRLTCFLLLAVPMAALTLRSKELKDAKIQVVETQCRGSASGHDAAIAILAKGPKKGATSVEDSFQDGGGSFQNTLKSIGNLPDKKRAVVRIFFDEEDNVSPAYVQDVIDTVPAPRDVCVSKIQFRKQSPGIQAHDHEMGYKHMIRFMFSDLIEEHMKDYKYWMRMDSNSVWSQPLTTDLFQLMDKNPEVAYIRNKENKDCGRLAEGLREMTLTFMKDKKLPLQEADVPALSDGNKACVKGYYNNVEVGRVSSFQTKPMQDWRNAVADSHGIYEHRWGDALLRRLSIELFGLKTMELPTDYQTSYRHYVH